MWENIDVNDNFLYVNLATIANTLYSAVSRG